jgi:hypothetical protein
MAAAVEDYYRHLSLTAQRRPKAHSNAQSAQWW